MRNYTVVSIIYGKSLKNRVADFMRKIRLIKVIYGVPLFDEFGNEIGCIATIKCCGKGAKRFIDKLFNPEGVVLDPITLDKRAFEVI